MTIKAKIEEQALDGVVNASFYLPTDSGADAMAMANPMVCLDCGALVPATRATMNLHYRYHRK